MIKILVLLLLTSICYADTYTYLVYMEHFPQNRYRISTSTENPTYRSFVDTGVKTSRQPFENTYFETNHNKKYGKITFTPKKDSEKNLFKAMQNRTYVKLLEINAVDYVFDAQKGGYESKPRNVPVSELPDDYYPEVIISTETYNIENTIDTYNVGISTEN